MEDSPSQNRKNEEGGKDRNGEGQRRGEGDRMQGRTMRVAQINV